MGHSFQLTIAEISLQLVSINLIFLEALLKSTQNAFIALHVN